MGRGGGDNTLKEVGELKICQNWGGINRQYLGHGTLNNRPTSRAARKENWGVRVRTGSHRKPQICSSREEVLVLTWLFFKIGEWFVPCYVIIFYSCKHEYLWAFLICTMLSLIWEIVSCILICKSSLFTQIRWIPTINLAGGMADIQNLRFQGLSNSQFFITIHVKRTSRTND